MGAGTARPSLPVAPPGSARPGSTGLARYENNPFANESLKTRAPVAVCSVTYGLAPHAETQLPPGSLRVEPQHHELGASASLTSSSSVAVLAVSSIA